MARGADAIARSRGACMRHQHAEMESHGSRQPDGGGNRRCGGGRVHSCTVAASSVTFRHCRLSECHRLGLCKVAPWMLLPPQRHFNARPACQAVAKAGQIAPLGSSDRPASRWTLPCQQCREGWQSGARRPLGRLPRLANGTAGLAASAGRARDGAAGLVVVANLRVACFQHNKKIKKRKKRYPPRSHARTDTCLPSTPPTDAQS